MTIEEYRNKMMALAEKDLPKGIKKVVFGKVEAQKLKRHMQSYAKSNVPGVANSPNLIPIKISQGVLKPAKLINTMKLREAF